MMNFIAKSQELSNIVHCLTLVKTFYVSSLIIGKSGNARRLLAQHILPNAPLVDGRNLEQVLQTLQINEEVIITNFEKISNFSQLNFDNKRVIAIALYQPKDSDVDDLFGSIYEISDLKNRPEDIQELATVFLQEAKQLLDIQGDIKLDNISFDLSHNSHSLKKSIYKVLLQNDMNQDDIQRLMYHYFSQNLEGNNDYKKFLYLYEKPLIEAGLERYKSQLKLADILGINRNTLRKKVNEYGL